MSCKVDDSALKKCQEGYEAFLDVVKAREAERLRRDKLLFEWSLKDSEWNRQHDEQLKFLEAGRSTTTTEVWDNGIKVDCNKI
jgi:hypothetical protein